MIFYSSNRCVGRVLYGGGAREASIIWGAEDGINLQNTGKVTVRRLSHINFKRREVNGGEGRGEIGRGIF
jgi:hypothetical protein